MSTVMAPRYLWNDPRVRIAAVVAVAFAVTPCGTASAAFPGRDGLIAFARGKPADIYVVRPDGSGLRRLTHSRRDDRSPEFSPDGRRIAFTRRDPDRAESGTMMVARPGGRRARRLRGDTRVWEWFQSWTPDSRYLFRRTDVDDPRVVDELWLMERGGARLLPLGHFNDFATASPDGTRMVISRYDVNDAGHYLVSADLDGSDARPLPQDRTGNSMYPDFSPDGRQIVFMGDAPLETDGYLYDLYVILADGGAARRLTDTSLDESAPAWSPSGRWIAYSHRGDIWVMRPDGCCARRVTRGPASDGEPSWQPVRR
jgi:Tol biopolymer transport system component